MTMSKIKSTKAEFELGTTGFDGVVSNKVQISVHFLKLLLKEY